VRYIEIHKFLTYISYILDGNEVICCSSL